MNDEHLKTLKEMEGDPARGERYNAAISFAISAIERSRWVAVDDRLPETKGVYHVTVDDDSVDEPEVFEAYWDGKEFVTNDVFRADIGTVTAWTKLEPYTPKEQI